MYSKICASLCALVAVAALQTDYIHTKRQVPRFAHTAHAQEIRERTLNSYIYGKSFDDKCRRGFASTKALVYSARNQGELHRLSLRFRTDDQWLVECINGKLAESDFELIRGFYYNKIADGLYKLTPRSK